MHLIYYFYVSIKLFYKALLLIFFLKSICLSKAVIVQILELWSTVLQFHQNFDIIHQVKVEIRSNNIFGLCFVHQYYPCSCHNVNNTIAMFLGEILQTYCMVPNIHYVCCSNNNMQLNIMQNLQMLMHITTLVSKLIFNISMHAYH